VAIVARPGLPNHITFHRRGVPCSVLQAPLHSSGYFVFRLFSGPATLPAERIQRPPSVPPYLFDMEARGVTCLRYLALNTSLTPVCVIHLDGLSSMDDLDVVPAISCFGSFASRPPCRQKVFVHLCSCRFAFSHGFLFLILYYFVLSFFGFSFFDSFFFSFFAAWASFRA